MHIQMGTVTTSGASLLMTDRVKSAFRIAVLGLGVAAMLVGNAHVAHAEFVGNLITVAASTGSDEGTWSFNVPTPSDPYSWQLDAPVDILGDTSGEVLGTIQNLSLSFDGDPLASIVFGVASGGAPTNFVFTSTLVAFAPIVNPLAVASAGINVTDLGGNGASTTGNFAGGTKSFEARYNGGTTFANLVSNVSAPAFGSNGTSEANPPVGTIPIAGAVSSIQVEFDFILSPNDLASGNGVFTVVVPEPSSFVLAAAGMVGLAYAIRRRRRK